MSLECFEQSSELLSHNTLDEVNASRQEKLCDGLSDVQEVFLSSAPSNCWISRAIALQMGQEGSEHRRLRMLSSRGSQPWLEREVATINGSPNILVLFLLLSTTLLSFLGEF